MGILFDVITGSAKELGSLIPVALNQITGSKTCKMNKGYNRSAEKRKALKELKAELEKNREQINMAKNLLRG